MGSTHDFIEALFGGALGPAALQIWSKDSKKSYSFQHVPTAADHAEARQDTDIYISAGLASKVAKPSLTRLTNNTAAGIPGVWADIDVNGGPDSKKGAAPDRDSAMQLASALLTPTVIVNSGYGVQAWWLFDGGAWKFATLAEREAAQKLVAGFQAALRAKAGYQLDSTHDLARLMRIPGTRNHKGADVGVVPVPVELVRADGPRYAIAAIEDVAKDHLTTITQAAAAAGPNTDSITLRGDAAQPSWRLGQLLAVDVEFKVIWERQKIGRTKEWSDSSFDLSIASRLVEIGCDDQEIADALVYSRLHAPSGDPQGKAHRLDYIARTISRARVRLNNEVREQEQTTAREEASEELEAIAVVNGTPADPGKTVSLFSTVLGGPEIKELVQDSRDPDQARFRLVLADGRIVPLGHAANLLKADKFRESFAVVTGHVVPDLKRDKWHKTMQALLTAAVVNEGDDDTRAARGKTLVSNYTDRALGTDREGAISVNDPFEHEDQVYVPLQPLVRWINKIYGERMPEADVRQLLIAAGFEKRTLNYTKDNGKKSSRAYWRIDKEELQ